MTIVSLDDNSTHYGVALSAILSFSAENAKTSGCRRMTFKPISPRSRPWAYACRTVADDLDTTAAYRGQSVGFASADVARERYLARITFSCNKLGVRAFATRRLERLRDPFPDNVNL
jgi:hypothetical protein